VNHDTKINESNAKRQVSKMIYGISVEHDVSPVSEQFDWFRLAR